jgi:hypothetical protein
VRFGIYLFNLCRTKNFIRHAAVQDMLLIILMPTNSVMMPVCTVSTVYFVCLLANPLVYFVDVGRLLLTLWACRWIQTFRRNMLLFSATLFLQNAGIYPQVSMALLPRPTSTSSRHLRRENFRFQCCVFFKVAVIGM